MTLTSRQRRELETTVRHVSRAQLAFERANVISPDEDPAAEGRWQLEHAFSALVEATTCLLWVLDATDQSGSAS